MRPFTYVRASGVDDAVAAAARTGATYLAGGTNLVDLMRRGAAAPAHVVDISALPLGALTDLPDGGLRLGALARNTEVAADPRVPPLLAQAIVNGASPQIRNRATVGGNLLQHTRCPYYQLPAAACDRRAPGTGCAARDAPAAAQRPLAVLGTGGGCAAVHPSDMCVALAALDAVVHVTGPGGARAIPLRALHRAPGTTPHVTTVLEPGELVTSVDLPPVRPGRSAYVKVRDRASFAFALVSAAVLVDVADGVIRAARIALGGVAARPWRAEAAETLLTGAGPEPDRIDRAASAAVTGARPLPGNAFKIALARDVLARTLTDLTMEEPA